MGVEGAVDIFSQPTSFPVLNNLLVPRECLPDLKVGIKQWVCEEIRKGRSA